jgi:hypothetical protein
MASAVADLEVGLQAMLNLKPPGVSGSRITSLTSLCVSNIQVRFSTKLLLVFAPQPLTRLACTVRIGSHPKDLHTLQEGSRNTQVGGTLRRRLCNPEMARTGQGSGTGNKQLCPGWNLCRWRPSSDGTHARFDE